MFGKETKNHFSIGRQLKIFWLCLTVAKHFHLEILRISEKFSEKFYLSQNASTKYCGPPYKCREFGPRIAIS